MKEEKDIKSLLEKAKKSILGAEVLLKECLYDFSASRSYYAMFYAAEVILLTKKLSFSTHAAVISMLGREFIKPGLLHQKLHSYIRRAFKLRQAGDYGASTSISKEDAEQLIEQAKEFIEIVEAYLKKEGYEI